MWQAPVPAWWRSRTHAPTTDELRAAQASARHLIGRAADIVVRRTRPKARYDRSYQNGSYRYDSHNYYYYPDYDHYYGYSPYRHQSRYRDRRHYRYDGYYRDDNYYPSHYYNPDYRSSDRQRQSKPLKKSFGRTAETSIGTAVFPSISSVESGSVSIRTEIQSRFLRIRESLGNTDRPDFRHPRSGIEARAMASGIRCLSGRGSNLPWWRHSRSPFAR